MLQQDLLNTLKNDNSINSLFQYQANRAPFAVGLPAGLLAAAAANLFQQRAQSLCLLAPEMESAAAFAHNLKALLPEAPIFLLPPLEISPLTDFQPEAEVIAERLQALSALVQNEPAFIVTPAESLLGKFQNKTAFQEERLLLRPGVELEIDELARRLVDLGYQREAMIDAPGAFACRGGIADIFPIGWSRPVRLDFFDREIESIRYFDPDTQRSAEACTQTLELYPCQTAHQQNGEMLLSYLPSDAPLLILEPALCEKSLLDAEKERQLYFDDLLDAKRLTKQQLQTVLGNYLPAEQVIEQINRRAHTGFTNLPQRSAIRQQQHIELQALELPSYTGQMPLFNQDLQKWQQNGWHIFFCASSQLRAERLRAILSEYDYPQAAIGVCALASGFEYPAGRLTVITEKELLGQAAKTKRQARNNKETDISTFVELKPGDYIVHTNHGVGLFTGIERVTADGVTADYLKIEYAAGDKLFIPAEQMHLVQKYIGSNATAPKLDRLGSNRWERVKAKVKASVQDMAEELLQLYAQRQKAQGYAFSPDTAWQREFEDEFEYEETTGQLQALTEIKRDMESSRPMDRLLCGDVGYGKTELAMRAAFKALQDGKQVALLAPTTLLAEQHFNTFSQRFANYPVKIGLLSRFVNAKKQKETMAAAAAGGLEILIGTHRLLSKDIKFADLGLLIVDEEQRFGVAHKERIKQMRGNIDVLTLSATPIPRTLHMSLVGMRDMSVINTPPKERLPVQTFVTEHHPRLLKNAIERELARQGQVYYIFNSVRNIEEKKAKLQQLVPQAKILMAHGQMTETQLNPVMTDFLAGDGDILLCTTIAEAGLDIPNVNTLIVENAENFGLAQLYQLRGRVGRSKRQAFAYFTYQPDKTLADDARKRLAAIRDFTQLGAGFKIAMRDLEIRGAGNLLGPEQHGHIAAVGFDLYCKLVNEAIEQGLGETPDTNMNIELKLDLGISAFIPESYIPETNLKFEIYNRISGCRSQAESVLLQNELQDRFGQPPQPVYNLFKILQIRNLAQALRINALLAPRNMLTLNFGEHNPFNGPAMLQLSQESGRKLKFSGQKQLLIKLQLQNQDDEPRLKEISAFLNKLLALINKK